jgi:hypothetical protein
MPVNTSQYTIASSLPTEMLRRRLVFFQVRGAGKRLGLVAVGDIGTRSSESWTQFRALLDAVVPVITAINQHVSFCQNS